MMCGTEALGGRPENRTGFTLMRDELPSVFVAHFIVTLIGPPAFCALLLLLLDVLISSFVFPVGWLVGWITPKT